MARTNVPVTTLTPNGGVVNPAATAINQANGMNVQLTSEGVPAGANSDRLVLIVTNSAAATHNAIVRAGAANPPAFRAGIGDITVAIPTTQTAYLGPFEWARIAQPDGSVNVDFDAGTTGTILAVLVPRSF